MVLEKYRRNFRTPENLNHFSEVNNKIAERKCIKFAMKFGEEDSSKN